PTSAAVLAASRFAWESELAGGDGGMLADDDELVVAADASLYYVNDLGRALRRVGVSVPQRPSPSASQLVLAAYRAWGDHGTDRLEGDFAFVVWSRRERRLLCARDFLGSRPLYYAALDGTLVVASSPAAILQYPGCSAALDEIALAHTAAALAPRDGRTCYRAISYLPAAHTLRWSADRALTVSAHWEAPVFERDSRVPFDDAALQLRALLERAVVERMAPDGVTSVWMSGGWDSTAVFGAGQAALSRGLDEDASGRRLLPVSISYPPGDCGREDELIGAVAERWRTPVHWLRSTDIPLFDDVAVRAARRAEPFAHMYEAWGRALAGGSREVGARVAMNGNGGDQLFCSTPEFVSDLLRAGSVRTLAREWRAFPDRGARMFWTHALKPLLPEAVFDTVAMARGGRPWLRTLERELPAWISPPFARRHGLWNAGRRQVGRREGEGAGSYFTYWMIASPIFPRVFASAASSALEEGVELRSPLFDRRIVEFAATRPRWERLGGGQTKTLLRRSMRGLLPPRVIAPRTHRTGTTRDYHAAAARRWYPMLLDDMSRSSRLADLGIVDLPSLRRAGERYLRDMNGDDAVNLFFTISTELWLRAREGGVAPVRLTNSPGRGAVRIPGDDARTLSPT
ncbi:MAG: asparagine synthase-related protein, partial [Gemmatimonadaceae bacterium]